MISQIAGIKRALQRQKPAAVNAPRTPAGRFRAPGIRVPESGSGIFLARRSGFSNPYEWIALAGYAAPSAHSARNSAFCQKPGVTW